MWGDMGAFGEVRGGMGRYGEIAHLPHRFCEQQAAHRVCVSAKLDGISRELDGDFACMHRRRDAERDNV